MGIKDLFYKKSLKVVPSSSLKSMGSEAESKDHIAAYGVDKHRYIPQIDYSKPKNFAKFGSAEEYYVRSVSRIYNTFPYDGSRKEIQEWHNSSSYLDKHIFDFEYPRTTGYVEFSTFGSGNTQTEYDNGGAHFAEPGPTHIEYIRIKSGPHIDPEILGGDKLNTYFSGKTKTNIYDTGSNRGPNLTIDGATGNTVEFWLKKDAFDTGTGDGVVHQREVVFDLATTASLFADPANVPLTTLSGRLTIELTGTAASNTSPWLVTYGSGTSAGVGLSAQAMPIGNGITPSTMADGKWHHYAFTFKNSGSNISTELYIDGDHNQTILSGTTINSVTSALAANIGARIAPLNDVQAVLAHLAGDTVPRNGWDRLSGAIDEFRFWKTARSSDQIQKFWFDQVAGGTNTDSANVELGVYYKFNEGISNTASVDQTILDYSGRISNGNWTTEFISNSRATGSALVESSASVAEYKDPIVYSFHPDVKGLYEDLIHTGSLYDVNNNASIYNSIPNWVIDEDEEDEEHRPGNIRKLTQILASYFDTLYLQIKTLPRIKDATYPSASFKPLPFANQLLESSGLITPEIFASAEIIEKFLDRDNIQNYEEKLHNIKNLIYQNIYNNLVFIYKSKGTEKSFRNLIRCFGVDDDLIKINLYANNETYTFEDNYKSTVVRKNHVDFNNPARFSAAVFQHTSSLAAHSTYSLTGSSIDSGSAQTFETEIHFPKKSDPDAFAHFPITFQSASLFGMHTTISGSTGWADATEVGLEHLDNSNFQVYAVRDKLGSNDAKFVLTGTAGFKLSTDGAFETELFKDVYDNKKWTFAVKVSPENYPLSNVADRSVHQSNNSYKVEFYGINTALDTIENSFSASTIIPHVDGLAFLTSSKTVYVGAHRTDFTGSALQESDVKVSSARYWMSYLTNEEINAHARDTDNFGVIHPYRNAFLFEHGSTGSYVPKIETLALYWDFAKVTGSDDSGEFFVHDLSSGSKNPSQRYQWLSEVTKKENTGLGIGFPTASSRVIDKMYTYSAKQQLPENLHASDTIKILTQDDEVFTRNTRPIRHYFAFEKSMYQTISEEMINLFATMRDFNNIIGEPINRYRGRYKDADKLKSLFFEKIANTPDFERYVEYYKWFDYALGILLLQLVPASAEFSEGIVTMVESHVLERNKYQNRFPTLEMKRDDPEGSIFGITELLYDWQFGHAPIPTAHKYIAFNGTANQSQLTVSDVNNNLSFDSDGTAANEPDFSFSAWINMTDASQFSILGKRNAYTNNSGLHEYIWATDTADKLILQIYDSDADSDGNIYIAEKTDAALTSHEGNWIHACATYDGSRSATGIKIYINGSEVASSATSLGSYTAMTRTGTDFFIGRLKSASGAVVSEGFIDEVAIFNKGLSAAEVTEVYRLGTTGNLNKLCSPIKNKLVSWWKMGEDATGTSPNYTIPDQIGDNDATMSAFQDDSTSDIIESSRSRGNGTEQCLWRHDRAHRDDEYVSSSHEDSDIAAQVDAQREHNRRIIGAHISASGPTFAQVGSSIDGTPKLITAYSGSEYALRRFTKIYNFDFKVKKDIHGGINYPPNKKQNHFKQIVFPDHEERYLFISASSIVGGSCSDGQGFSVNDYSLNNKVNLGFTIGQSPTASSTNPKDYSFTKGHLLAPFNIYSSSVSGGHNMKLSTDFVSCPDPSLGSNYEFTNLHSDGYGKDYEVPMQGPFTETHVGGHQHRHVEYNRGARTPHALGLYIPDVPQNRPEAWHISFSDNVAYIRGPGSGSEGGHKSGGWMAKAQWMRDEYAKRPVNIRNIKHTTASARELEVGSFNITGSLYTLGNYYNDYEVIQSIGGRSNQNRYFIKTGGDLSSQVAESNALSGTLEFPLPDRTGSVSGSSKWVITERFSAPGGPEVMSRGFLDVEAEEYSVYNTLNYRNLTVRQPLHSLLTGVCGQFGFDADIVGHQLPSTGYKLTYKGPPGSASYHKVHRNTLKRIEHTGSGDFSDTDGGFFTASKYDNWYVQHPIPRSDLQYSWITSSYVTSRTFGYIADDGMISSSADGRYVSSITFASASNFGSYFSGALRQWGYRSEEKPDASDPNSEAWLPTNFVGMHFHIYEPITASENTLGWTKNDVLVGGNDTSLHRQQYRNLEIIKTMDSTSEAGTPGLGAPQIFNALMLHRNGPYQYPSWKQIRTGDHPIARHQRQNNIYTRESASKETVYQSIHFWGGIHVPWAVAVNYPDVKLSFIEPPLISKYYPIVTKMTPAAFLAPEAGLGLKTQFHWGWEFVNKFHWGELSYSEEHNEGVPYDGLTVLEMPVDLKHTYGNNLAAFSHTKLAEETNYKTENLRANSRQIYDDLVELYPLGSSRSSLTSWHPPAFRALIYTETVWPRESNTYLKRTRMRTNFSSGSYRSDRDARRLQSYAALQHPTPPSIAVVGMTGSWDGTGTPNAVYRASMWPLDARENFVSGSSLRGYVDGSGRLMNNHVQFWHDWDDHQDDGPSLVDRRVEADVLYARRFPTDWDSANANTKASGAANEFYAGDTLWEAAEQAGKHPIHDSYDAFSDDIRRIGKGYSIIPEYRISEHIPFYITSSGANLDEFLTSNPNMLSLTGGAPQDDGATDTNFFDVYSHSDFLKHFNVIHGAHDDFGPLSRVKGTIRNITLQCHGIMKFLPYEGFYPAQRTTQLYDQFRASYFDFPNGFIELTGKESGGGLRAITTPLFSPGILFNSIKSGVAVNYPIYTTSSLPIFENNDEGIPRLMNSPSRKLPFEALFFPEGHLEGVNIVDSEPHPSASLDCTASMKGAGDPLYKMAMHNFLAEVPKFFLRGGKLTKHESLPDNDPNFGQVNIKHGEEDKTYAMRVVMSHAHIRTEWKIEGAQAAGKTLHSASYEWNPPTLIMYHRGLLNHQVRGTSGGDQEVACLTTSPVRTGPGGTFSNVGATGGDQGTGLSSDARVYGSSFGPPSDFNSRFLGQEDYADNFLNLTTRAAFMPYTPPYYDGYAAIDLWFSPQEARKYTAEEILAELQVDGLMDGREGLQRIPTIFPKLTPTGQANAYRGHGPALTDMMHITASINHEQLVPVRKEIFDANGNITGYEDFETPAARWVIETKWETPVLNFMKSSHQTPLLGSASVDRGMWHQYGHIPKNSEGLFFEIQDIEPDEFLQHGLTPPDSLADLVGFKSRASADRASKKIGQVADSKIIREAVVAVPMWDGEFFFIKKGWYWKAAKAMANGELPAAGDGWGGFKPAHKDHVLPDESIVDMINKMKKYIFPPKMDFITNDVVDPFAMYIFEFEHELTKTDLADIWQNLPPDIGTNFKTATATVSHDFAKQSIIGSRVTIPGGGNWSFVPGKDDYINPSNKGGWATAQDLWGAHFASHHDADHVQEHLSWMVFKVKQKAEKDYYSLTSAEEYPWTHSKIHPNKPKTTEDYKYSFNWPYDFFSLVELAKLDTKFTFEELPLTANGHYKELED